MSDPKRKKLPGTLQNVWKSVESGSGQRCYENQNGFRCMKPDRPKKIYHAGGQDDASALLYTEFDEPSMRLSVNEILLDGDGRFYGREIASLLYCPPYNEIDSCGAALEKDPDAYAGNGLDGARNFLECVLARQDWLLDASGLLNGIIDTGKGNVLNVLDVFLSGFHKMFPLLLEHKGTDNITWLTKALLSGEADCRGFASPAITKKALRLALDTGVRLDTCLRATERFNPSEVAKFAKMADFMGYRKPGKDAEKKHFQETDLCIERICQIPGADFTAIADYMVKQSILLGNFKIENGPSHLLSHVQLYADYVQALVDSEADPSQIELYPDNLRMAHDIAVKSASIHYKGKSFNVPAFRKATAKYAEYAWEYKDYRFLVPAHPEDLIRNAEEMHHCVDTYIQKVADEKSRIVIVTRSGKPVMTIEVLRSAVYQAKGPHDNRPLPDDLEALSAWACEKGLEIRRM